MTPRMTSTRTDVGDALALLTAPPTQVELGLAFTRTGREPGTAPTLLLVHGVGASRLVWAPVLPALAQRYDVLVVDLPGHGASAPLAPDADARCRALARHLAAALVELEVARPHVVGNSLGGWVALELAADHAVSSLTALAPAGLRLVPAEPNPVLHLNRRLAQATGRLADPLLGWGFVRRIVMASGSVDPAALHPDLARGTVRALRECTAYERMLAATARTRFDRKGEITAPTTVVFGDRDRILPRPNQHRELAPGGARWEVLPRCGHAPMWDAVSATVALVDETVTAGS